jgi:hypothetical protein
MANEIAEVLIPDPMTAVTGITRVSPTAQVDEFTLPMVVVMVWACEKLKDRRNRQVERSWGRCLMHSGLYWRLI